MRHRLTTVEDYSPIGFIETFVYVIMLMLAWLFIVQALQNVQFNHKQKKTVKLLTIFSDRYPTKGCRCELYIMISHF